MHSAKHAGNESINAIALLDERHQSRYPTFIVRRIPEVSENQLLEGFDLVLQVHEIGYSLIALIGVVDPLQADILFIFEEAIELGMGPVESKL